MGEKILTKTERQLAERQQAVAGDPGRARVIATARAFKQTWLELARELARVQSQQLWRGWGFDDFDAYCRRELHLRTATVAKLLGSYRFLETAAPRVLSRSQHASQAQLGNIPSLATVAFVAKATEHGAADRQTLQQMHVEAFDEGVEAPLLSRRYKEVAFPVEATDKDAAATRVLANAARRLASLLAVHPGVPHDLAARLERSIGELLGVIESN
ncbi:MAG: hypothetical protein IPL79_01675 [Myxococcales bacterium]|nr:hypothetical protein [Myxococcales bacterium]